MLLSLMTAFFPGTWINVQSTFAASDLHFILQKLYL
jgi:hypothetical protein